MFEATKDGMQVMAGEDPRVAVNTVTSKPGPPKNAYKSKEIQTATRDKRPARQMWKVWLSCPQATRDMSSQE